MFQTSRPTRVEHLAVAAVAAVFVLASAVLLVTDVWDETRGLQLVRTHGLLELVASNWTPAPDPPVVLFRPLPMLAVTLVARLAPTWPVAWGAMRLLVAAAAVAATLLLVGAIGRLRPETRWRRPAVAAGILLSASGVLAAGWFAMAFDVGALLMLAAGIALLLRGRPLAAGLLLGGAVFCKESALIAAPAAAALVAGRVPRRDLVRAATVAVAVFVLYLAGRFALVPPGSARDLHQLALADVAGALLRLPGLLWWQLADPPSVVAGWAASGAFLAALRSRRAVGAAIATIAVAAILYGPMVHLGGFPLLDADHFAPRLYLVPVAALLVLAAVEGRRWALWLVLVPLLWGGVTTGARHLRFQHAYQRVYRVAADTATADRPLRVHCELYRRPFTDRRRGLELGLFPGARWELRTDGALLDRSAVDRSASRRR